ncbi:MAG TPA: hypothetical protein VFC63_03125 [Blastocatellia bacterium]|nr:hypothetical protein [Blastocatellia bacterium]
MQRKAAAGNQPQTPPQKRPPVPPEVYRPQPVPKVLQRKTAGVKQPVNPSAGRPAPPPVYRPQAAPKVLQKKSADSQQQVLRNPSRQANTPPLHRPEVKQEVKKIARPEKTTMTSGSVSPKPTPSRPVRAAFAGMNVTIQRKPEGVVNTPDYRDPDMPGAVLSLIATEVNGRVEIYKIDKTEKWLSYSLASEKYFTYGPLPSSPRLPVVTAKVLADELKAIIDELPSQKELAALFTDLKQKAGLSIMGERKKEKFEKLKTELKEFEERMVGERNKFAGYVDKIYSEYFFTPESEKKVREQFKIIEKQVEGLQDIIGKYRMQFGAMKKKVYASEKDKEKIVVEGTYGVMTQQAYDSIPAPYDSLNLLKSYLSTITKPHGQAGIHIRTNKDVVLKFLGVLGNMGIYASGMKNDKYLFHKELTVRH